MFVKTNFAPFRGQDQKPIASPILVFKKTKPRGPGDHSLHFEIKAFWADSYGTPTRDFANESHNGIGSAAAARPRYRIRGAASCL